MNLIMNDPAAWGSIVALTVLIVGGAYAVYRAVSRH
jgi:hypothetical protein